MATIKDHLDAAIKMAAKRGHQGSDAITMAHNTVRLFLKAKKPNLHMLYSAAWSAGYTVNGIVAPRA